MKKICLFLVAAVVLFLTGCGNSDSAWYKTPEGNFVNLRQVKNIASHASITLNDDIDIFSGPLTAESYSITKKQFDEFIKKNPNIGNLSIRYGCTVRFDEMTIKLPVAEKRTLKTVQDFRTLGLDNMELWMDELDEIMDKMR